MTLFNGEQLIYGGKETFNWLYRYKKNSMQIAKRIVQFVPPPLKSFGLAQRYIKQTKGENKIWKF